MTQKQLDDIFPASKTDDFFEALFGGAEDGAYDIRLECERESDKRVDLVFALTRRPGHCLRCQLTSGLPHVFERHPVIDAAGTARAVGALKGWTEETITWTIGDTRQLSEELHQIPFTVIAN